jgi:hypothetical protein
VANISIPSGRGVVVPREVVQERIADVLRRHPDLVSFDPLDERYENLIMRCKLDPGVPKEERDGWTGQVCDWYFGTYSMVDDKTGEVMTLPSLSLWTSDGICCRLTNSEPAVRAWLAILREIGVERVKRGLMVRVALRHSAGAVGPYWTILPA